jgi:hypothetical protein
MVDGGLIAPFRQARHDVPMRARQHEGTHGSLGSIPCGSERKLASRRMDTERLRGASLAWCPGRTAWIKMAGRYRDHRILKRVMDTNGMTLYSTRSPSMLPSFRGAARRGSGGIAPRREPSNPRHQPWDQGSPLAIRRHAPGDGVAQQFNERFGFPRAAKGERRRVRGVGGPRRAGWRGCYNGRGRSRSRIRRRRHECSRARGSCRRVAGRCPRHRGCRWLVLRRSGRNPRSARFASSPDLVAR